MYNHVIRRIWLTGWTALLVLLAAGCFQPAGAGLEATIPAQAQPTYTPYPTDTWTPEPPTEAPTEFPTDIPIESVVVVEPTLDIFADSTLVADAGLQELDPIWQTATAQFLLQQGDIIPVNPLEGQEVQPIDQIDPLLQTATVMIREATEAAGVPLTQTAQAIFGPPTATFEPIFPTATFSSGVPVPTGSDCIYEVQPTDTNLYRISLLFGIPYMNIAQASNLVNPNLIHVGDKLVIPGCGTTGYQPPPTSFPNQPGVTPVPGGGGGTYIVQQGDTLFGLSLQWGTTVNAIAAINGIQNINLIYIGQTLTIPA